MVKVIDRYLIEAVKQDDFKLVLHFLNIDADIEVRDDKGNTPIFGVKSVDMLKLLIENRARIDVLNRNGETPVMEMINKKNAKCLKCLIENGADLSLRNLDLASPLCVAVKKDFKEGVRILLDSGVEIDTDNKYGRTELMFAKSKEVQDMLLEFGADVNVKDDMGKSLFDFVIENEGKVELIENLLKKGKFSYEKDRLLEKALQTAILNKYHREKAFRKEDWEDGDKVIECLIRNGGRIKSFDDIGVNFFDGVSAEGVKFVFDVYKKLKKDKMVSTFKGLRDKFLRR